MAMSSIMSNLGGFMGCTSSSFTTRVCQRKGDTSDGPHRTPSPPKTRRVDGHTDSPVLGTTLAPCLLFSQEGCPPFWGGRARAVLPAPSHKAQLEKASSKPVPSPGTQVAAEPSRGGPSCHPTMCLTPPSYTLLRSPKPRSSTVFCSETSLVVWANS